MGGRAELKMGGGQRNKDFRPKKKTYIYRFREEVRRKKRGKQKPKELARWQNRRYL